MSITSVPPDIILEIGKYFQIQKIIAKGHFFNSTAIVYPLRNLYATCKSFYWLDKLEYLCVQGLGTTSKIISRNIHGHFNGTCFQGHNLLMGYYGSDQPKSGYNYSEWSTNILCEIIMPNGRGRVTDRIGYTGPIGHVGLSGANGGYFYRYSNNIRYYDHGLNRHRAISYGKTTTCYRYINGSCKKCPLCTQLDEIQRDVFEKDTDVKMIFENRYNYTDGFVLIRERKPLLDFKFDYSGFITA
jgi:hypothetical protein